MPKAKLSHYSGISFCNVVVMRKFQRESVSLLGCIITEPRNTKIVILDFSRMGLAFITDQIIPPKTFLSIAYQNEVGSIIQTKIYVKNVSQKNSLSNRIGAQFAAVESRI